MSPLASSSLIERMAAAAANEAARLDCVLGIPWDRMAESQKDFCRAIMLKAFVAGSDASEGETIEALLLAVEMKEPA